MLGLYTNQHGMIFILVPRAEYKFPAAKPVRTAAERLKDALLDNLRQKAATITGDRIGRYYQLYFAFYKPKPPAASLPEPWPIGAAWHPMAEPIESPISRRKYYIIEPDALTLALLIHPDTPADMLRRFFKPFKRASKPTATESEKEYPTYYDEDGNEYEPGWRTPRI